MVACFNNVRLLQEAQSMPQAAAWTVDLWCILIVTLGHSWTTTVRMCSVSVWGERRIEGDVIIKQESEEKSISGQIEWWCYLISRLDLLICTNVHVIQPPLGMCLFRTRTVITVSFSSRRWMHTHTHTHVQLTLNYITRQIIILKSCSLWPQLN